MPTISHIRDLIADKANRRQHNPRNIGMVVDALQKVGAARSIVIDEHGVILAGNGVTEAAAEAGITKVRVIDASGDELIAVRRTGLTPAQKRHLAIADNRGAELATWNVEQLAADLANGEDRGCIIVVDKTETLAGYVGTATRMLAMQMKIDTGTKLEDILAKELSLAGYQRQIDPMILTENAVRFFQFGEFSGWIIESPFQEDKASSP